MPATPAIEVDNLTKVYTAKGKATRAVDGISFALAPGTVTGLLGGNGAGKTTTIAMILGLIEPTSGHARVMGAEMPRERYRVLHRMNFESPYVDMPNRLTVRQNLTVFGRLYAVEDLRERIAAIAGQLDLSDLLDRPTGKLSAGQKTRVSLAKALINRPDVLLLDEPTASLDPDTADWVRSHLERYRAEQNATILLASHNMARGRAPVRPRHHHEARQDRGRRRAGGAAGALRPRQSRRRLPRRRARARRSRPRGRAMSAPSTSALALSPHRVYAMVLRYLYLLRSSWSRVLDLIYWPAVQLFVWGFLQHYLAQNSGFFARAAGMFIGAVLLWDILFRGQLGFSVSFLEEMWSRNLANLMFSPLRPIEFVAALMVMSIVRLAIGMVPVTILAIVFFGFNLYCFGFALVAFFLNLLLTSWAVGIVVSGVVMRNGMGAETLAWTMMFILMPLACVYYPVSVLPEWLQWVAWALPPTYVFEGMRALVLDQTFRADLMIAAFALNLVYFAIAVAVFLALLRSARRIGSLLQSGE